MPSPPHRVDSAGRPAGSGGRAWLLLAAGMGLILRASFLTQPMRYDEAYSFMSFVHGGLRDLFWYPLPNNHVLNTLLEKLSCRLAGATPLGIRLPAFLSGMALIPLAAGVSRKLAGPPAGAFAALGVAVLPFLVLYSANGRGYALLALLAIGLLYLALDQEGRLRPERWPALAVVSALGLFTIPSMLYALAGFTLWCGAVLWAGERGSRAPGLRFLIAYGLATALLSLLFYAPVAYVSGIGPLTSNPYVRALPWDRFAAGVLPHLLAVRDDFGWGLPPGAALLLLALLIAGAVSAARRGKPALALLLPMLLLGAAVLFVFKRSIPFTRTWIYLIPAAFIVMDAGLTILLRGLGPAWYRAVLAAAAASAGLIALHLVSGAAPGDSPDSGTAPDAAPLARRLAPQLTRQDLLCAELPADAPLMYYLWRELQPAPPPAGAGPGRRLLVHSGAAAPLRQSLTPAPSPALVVGQLSVYDLSGMGEAPYVLKSFSCWSPAATLGLSP